MEVFLNQIANSGPWGPIVAISLTINFYLGRRLLNEMNKRIMAAERTRDTLVEPLSSINRSLQLITDKIVTSKEAISD